MKQVQTANLMELRPICMVTARRDVSARQAAEMWAESHFAEPREIEHIELVTGEPLAVDFKLKNGVSVHRCAWESGSFIVSRFDA